MDAMLLLFASAAISALVTWLSIHYARRYALLDLPGQRRSHSVPTPRGGGIGIVVAVLCVLAWVPLDQFLRGYRLPAALAVALVAVVGWIDDHRGLSVRTRLLAHLIAVVVMYFPLFDFGRFLWWLGGDAAAPAIMLPANSAVLFLATAAVFVVANLWFVNLHNFMDGIDGLLASQSIFVFVALACLVQPNRATVLLACAAAVLGFLPFNFPRARVFMGDVGSGVLGLLIAAAVVLAAFAARGSVFAGLIACSAFVTDASCTLASRMLRGRRWYSAHREHLYQWMVRTGMSHARVVACYMAWNLCLVAPVLWWLNRVPEPGLDHGTGIFLERNELIACAVIYAVAAALWLAGKRWCLRQVKIGGKPKV